MTDNELIAALRLQRIPNIGDISAKKLIAVCGSPSAVFFDKREHLVAIDGIGSWSISGLWDGEHLEAAEKEWEYIKKNQITCCYYQDPDYPVLLKNCPDGPILFFAQGKMHLKQQRMLSVVGTRNMTRKGRAFCESFIEEIAPAGPVIVSGMAYGVDICAQRAAMDLGLQTIGCLGHGLNQIYPRQHAADVLKMKINGGCISEFWSTSKPERENFLKRNRIIAGISHATVIIESAEKGGSLVTADLAFGYNREVFAVPGRPDDAYSQGCNALIKSQKAQLISKAADVIYFMDWDSGKEQAERKQRSLFVPLEPREEKIYNMLCTLGRKQADDIALECDLPVYTVSATLLNMEMKGVVRPLPGKWFEAI